MYGGVPIEAWNGTKHDLKMNRTFGCLVQYLKAGVDKDPKSAKFASRTEFGIFLGMPVAQSGFLIFDPKRAGMIVRSDVRFFEDVPGYPRLMSHKARSQEPAPVDSDFFTIFPEVDDDDDAPPATPSPTAPPLATTPQALIPLPIPPISVVELSDDTDVGGDAGNENDEASWVGDEDESIADRVAARRRAHFASFGDVL